MPTAALASRLVWVWIDVVGLRRDELALVDHERRQALRRADDAVDGGISHDQLSVLRGELSLRIDREVARASE